MTSPTALQRLMLALTTSILVQFAHAQEVIPLWPHGAPGFEQLKDEPEQAADWWVRHINNPSLVVYRPAPGTANGMAMVIAPGGGHANLVFNSEGRDPALFLAKLGVTAFVLKYRLAREAGSPYRLDVHPRQDAYRAIRTVRSRSAEFGIDPRRIGMMGFSAGGEVVASVAYASGAPEAGATDPIDRTNGKPNFQVLVYPGPLGIPEQVPADAPPAFMVAAMDDPCCVKPLLALATRYQAAKVPADVHLYFKGDHAFNMGQRSTQKGLRDWPQRLADWLLDAGWMTPSKP